MSTPPKQKRAPAKSALPKLRLLTKYRVAAVPQPRSAGRSGYAEQWRGRLQDRIDNERRGQ